MNIIGALLAIGEIIVAALLFTVPFYSWWNWLIPQIFGLPEITLLQSMGLSLMIVFVLRRN